MKIHPGFVGIDISKHHLDVFDSTRATACRIANQPAAIAALLDSLEGRPALVLFEATGSYDRALRHALGAADMPFARVNPARARDFARAAGYLAKTDTIDARMLAAMAQALSLEADARADPLREQLARLHQRRDQLVACRKQERMRQKEESDDPLRSLETHLAFLDEAIAAFDDAIAALIKAHDELRDSCSLMLSAPGIGKVHAATLLALMPELGARSSKTVAALAGLAPFNADSGLARGKRQIRGGRRRVREALYMAAVAATRTKSRFAEQYRALRQAGKAPKLALIAVARKILVTLNAILRDRKPFYP